MEKTSRKRDNSWAVRTTARQRPGKKGGRHRVAPRMGGSRDRLALPVAPGPTSGSWPHRLLVPAGGSWSLPAAPGPAGGSWPPLAASGPTGGSWPPPAPGPRWWLLAPPVTPACCSTETAGPCQRLVHWSRTGPSAIAGQQPGASRGTAAGPPVPVKSPLWPRHRPNAIRDSSGSVMGLTVGKETLTLSLPTWIHVMFSETAAHCSTPSAPARDTTGYSLREHQATEGGRHPGSPWGTSSGSSPGPWPPAGRGLRRLVCRLCWAPR